MEGRRSGKKVEKTLGDWAKRVAIAEAELARCGLERRQPNIREGRPLQKVAEWVQDNDFAGQRALPPAEDMERLDKEIRATIADLEKPVAQNTRMAEDFANFWIECSKCAMPTVDVAAQRPSSKQKKDKD